MKIEKVGRTLGATLALATMSMNAWALEDMPGGPMVNQLNLTAPASKIAEGQHMLHDVLMWVSVIIFVAVFSVMFYSVFAHRKSKGYKPADFHESTAVEIAWTIVPFIIVVGLGVVATSEVIAQKDTSSADLTVKATGYQWKWGYDYVRGEGEGIGFLSTISTPQAQIRGEAEKSVTYLTEVDNPLVVPVGKKVRVILTANDVIHSWYVPALGVKQDAIPGFVRDTWFKAEKVGTYRGYCAELCGKDHAFMPVVVEVKSAKDFSAWVAKKQVAMAPAEGTKMAKAEAAAPAEDPNKEWTVEDLSKRGETAYVANCGACHQASGKGLGATFPALAGSKVVLGPMDEQLKIVLKGRPGTAMASFAHLSDTDLAAIITYTRNAFGNKAEQNLIQPSAVQAAR